MKKEYENSIITYRYYSTQRPVMPGSYPEPRNNKVLKIENFDHKKFVEEVDRPALGFISWSFKDWQGRSWWSMMKLHP